MPTLPNCTWPVSAYARRAGATRAARLVAADREQHVAPDVLRRRRVLLRVLRQVGDRLAVAMDRVVAVDPAVAIPVVDHRPPARCRRRRWRRSGRAESN